MSFLGGFFIGDDSRGKKSDDRKKPTNAAVLPTAWSAKKSARPGPPLRRRIVYVLLALIAVYFFVKNIPSDLGPSPGRRPNYKKPEPAPQTSVQSEKPTQGRQPPPEAPSRSGESAEEDEHYFNGRIKFYKLAASLHAAASASGAAEDVLFAASSLSSASNMMPLACAMQSQKRNNVHFVFMGRNDIDLDEIKEVNGIDDNCDIAWHDGRPDYSRWSSDYRMEVSVAAGLGHIDNFIEPLAIITDGSGNEDAFFTNSIRRKTHDLDKVLIELPSDAIEKMMWITRLDGGSLAAWSTTYVEILIHAPRESSGSLVRLLRSIEEADYFNYRRPHLTVELPEEVDPATWQYLQELIWPPLGDGGTAHQSQVTLRHRVPRGLRNSQETAAHMVESFYPARVLDSHVLVLSPQVELSPLYYHYLTYALLEYKYSSSGRGLDIRDVFGISLDLPAYYLNDSQPFEPPTILSSPSISSGGSSKSEGAVPFLWQAPNSNAALYFGDKWVEFHSFLTRRLAATKLKTTPIYHKQITDKYPSWMEFLLELIRARGYTMLYPNFGSNGIVTVHNDLYQEPEESRTKQKKKPLGSSSRSGEQDGDFDPSEPFTIDPSDFPSIGSSPSEHSLLSSDLLSLLPDSSGPLPALSSLPLLSYQGNSLNAAHFTSAAHNYAKDFRREVGHCSPNDESPRAIAMSAADLFCNIPGFVDDADDDATAFKESGSKEDAPINPNPEPLSYDPPDPILTEEYVPPPPKPDKADSSENTQNEFEAHLNRQAASAGPSGKIKGKSKQPEQHDDTSSQSKETADAATHDSDAVSDRSAKAAASEETLKHVERQTKKEGGNSANKKLAPGGNEKGTSEASFGKPGSEVDPRKLAVKGGEKGQVPISSDTSVTVTDDEHKDGFKDKKAEKGKEQEERTNPSP